MDSFGAMVIGMDMLDKAMQREMLNEDADVEIQQQDCPTKPGCLWWQEIFEEVGGGNLRSIGYRCENDGECEEGVIWI